MRKMTSHEIRTMWLKYFTEHGHKIVESAPLIPYNDDSLLWINAGVTPLKKYFDGTMVPESRRLTNLQKCIRTNDIENVGVTRRHHTFFEMMGNFSIGDYFKNEAIEMSFELLTGKEWFDIPKEKLYVTVFPDDKEAIDKWISVGFIKDHIIPLKDNFWEIGPGPCGPDSEIFFDRGEKYDPEGDALERFKKDLDNERYVEIWNNVFSQFNSEEGKKRSEYKELPSKNIDTGAGIERWACILQDVDSNFDTDLFMPIMRTIEELSGLMYDGSMPFKVIADHIRALTFAISDGAYFENVGRGYILRRLLRRSVRYGKKLGLNELFMYKLVDSVVDIMKEDYPYLINKKENVKELIKQEEELFSKTLNQGEKKLYELMDESIDNTISGYDAFKLYDTYGFPFELTLEYLEEKGYTTNKSEFLKYMEEQKKLSKNNQKHDNVMNVQNELLLKYTKESEFVYEVCELKSKIIDLIKDEKLVDSLDKEGYVILDKTCFYATQGGEEADTGLIISDSFKARVLDVFKAPNGQNVHKVKVLSGTIKNDLNVTLLVDKEKRMDTCRNHSSVHLLQYALRTIISKEITQAGSRVDEQSLRFDFNYNGKISDNELIEVENLVNKLINDKIERVTNIEDLDKIDKNEVMALFSEKYNKKVRVVNIGPSHELCGGCHVNNTSDIKKFAILSLINKGSNTYRIIGATNNKIESMINETCKVYNDEIVKLLLKSKNILKNAKDNGFNLHLDYDINNDELSSYKDITILKSKLSNLQDKVKELEKEYNRLRENLEIKDVTEFTKDIKMINDINILIKKVNNYDINTLKQILDNLANEYESIFIFIANVNDNNVNYISRSNCKHHSGNILKESLKVINASGGGSEKFAQGGSKELNNVDLVLDKVKELI